MNRDFPLVSLVVGTYNAAEFIADTLDSMLAQTYPNIEVVVVDDGSTDGTRDILRLYAGRIVLIEQSNGGIPAVRNRGIAVAGGEYIALMDHDDLCEPERIAVQMAVMRQLPDVVLCGSEFSAFNSAGPIEPRHSATYYTRAGEHACGVAGFYAKRTTIDIVDCLPSVLGDAGGAATTIVVSHGDVYESLAMGNFVHPPTVLFRRSASERVGNFQSNARTICDWDWLVRIARQGPLAHIDRPLLRYRRSTTQISSPKHALRRAVDALATADLIIADDPALYARRRAEFDRVRHSMFLDIAGAMAESDKLGAWAQLRQAWQASGVSGRWALLALKASLPSALWQAGRRLGRLAGPLKTLALANLMVFGAWNVTE